MWVLQVVLLFKPCLSLCLPLLFRGWGRWVTGFGAVYLLHYSESLWCWLWTGSGWGLLFLNSFLSSGTEDFALWITCSWTSFLTFLMTYLLEGIIKSYRSGDMAETMGWGKQFSLLRLCCEPNLRCFEQNSVWQKENRTVWLDEDLCLLGFSDFKYCLPQNLGY